MAFENYPGSFSGYPGSFAAYPDEHPGILRGIVKEVGRDILGGFNVANATLGEFLDLMGIAAPVTYEDLEARDYKGALMLGALAAGGWVGSAARGIPVLSAMAGSGAATTRAAGLAMAEAAAGAAMGMIRPLEDDESRTRAILGDAAFTGAFGAGFSFAASAWKATLGGRIAAIKAQGARVAEGRALGATENINKVREYAGVMLFNKETEAKLLIRRGVNGNISRTLIDKSGYATEKVGADMQAVLGKAVEEGFTDPLAPQWTGSLFRKHLGDDVAKHIDEATLKTLEAAEFDPAVLGPMRIQEYTGVREAARLRAEAGQELGALAGEVMAPTQGYGPVKLGADARASIAKELKMDASLPDGDLLRAAFRNGLVTADTAKAGIDLDRYTKDLFLSNSVPEVPILINNFTDAVGTSLLLPSRIAKIFPQFSPVYKEADRRFIAMDETKMAFDKWLSVLRQKVSPKKAAAAVDIIDKSGGKGVTLEIARQKAIADARATGDQEIIFFVEQATEKLSEYLIRAQGAQGLLEQGLSGYFPMVLADKWSLQIKGMTNREIAALGGKRFYSTAAEAQKFVDDLGKAGREVTYEISPRGYKFPIEIAQEGPDGIKRLENAFDEAFTQGKTLKSTPFAEHRTLGLRDFSKDPFAALEIYGASMEKAIHFRDFEKVVKPYVDAIPTTQPRLKAAAEQYVADMMGKIRPQEEMFQAVLEHIGYDAPPRALKKYSAALRKWEAFSRLGGPFSAIINQTQIALNTNAKLGTKWTAAGMEVFVSPSKYKAAVKALHEAGVDIGHLVPFVDEGSLIAAFGSPTAAFKERRYVEALHRMWLSMFHGAEKNNRLVTAWGAYKKALSEGLTGKQAGGYAQEIVDLTQFNYRFSNTPDLLRTPLGGLLLQFKSFVINEIDFIASLNKQEALRFGAAVWGLGGTALVMNMPGTDIINAASTMFFDRKVDEAMAVAQDKGPVQRALFYGLPGLVNIDMSDYIGVGAINEITYGVFGPAVSDAEAVYSFIKDAALDLKTTGRIADETSTALIQKAAPSAVRRAMRGYDIFKTGEVRNPYSNKLIYRPTNRMRAAVQQAIGFPELEMTEQRAADAIVTRARDSYIRGRTSFVKSAAQAMREGRHQDAQNILGEARANGYVIDQRSINYWLKEFGRSAAERRERNTPKALRQQYQELFEATGQLELGL